MNYIKWCYKSFKRADFIKNLLACVGVELSFLKLADYLYKDARCYLEIKSYILLFFYLIAFVYAFYKAIPKQSIVYKMDKKDIKIEIRIGNIFNIDNHAWYIVPIDTAFQVGLNDGKNLKIKKSVLANLVNKYFSGNPSLLQEQIDLKKGAKNKIGDIVPVFYSDSNFLFLANSSKEPSTNKVKQDSDILDDVLGNLWLNLDDICENERIAVPLLNTGYAGNHNNRLDVIKKIINSFISAVQSGNGYCSHLIVSIYENDFYKYIQDDFYKIEAYLKYMSYNYSDIKLESYKKKSEPRISIL
jgi:hypothetical protein